MSSQQSAEQYGYMYMYSILCKLRHTGKNEIGVSGSEARVGLVGNVEGAAVTVGETGSTRGPSETIAASGDIRFANGGGTSFEWRARGEMVGVVVSRGAGGGGDDDADALMASRSVAASVEKLEPVIEWLARWRRSVCRRSSGMRTSGSQASGRISRRL